MVAVSKPQKRVYGTAAASDSPVRQIVNDGECQFAWIDPGILPTLDGTRN